MNYKYSRALIIVEIRRYFFFSSRMDFACFVILRLLILTIRNENMKNTLSFIWFFGIFLVNQMLTLYIWNFMFRTGDLI